jgi:hypothetical protein
MWAAEDVKFGYKWKIGNVRSVKFWEHNGFGNTNLATRFWDIYFVSNQQSKTIAELWDGTTLRYNFSRTFF